MSFPKELADRASTMYRQSCENPKGDFSVFSPHWLEVDCSGYYDPNKLIEAGSRYPKRLKSALYFIGLQNTQLRKEGADILCSEIDKESEWWYGMCRVLPAVAYLNVPLHTILTHKFTFEDVVNLAQWRCEGKIPSTVCAAEKDLSCIYRYMNPPCSHISHFMRKWLKLSPSQLIDHPAAETAETQEEPLVKRPKLYIGTEEEQACTDKFISEFKQIMDKFFNENNFLPEYFVDAIKLLRNYSDIVGDESTKYKVNKTYVNKTKSELKLMLNLHEIMQLSIENPGKLLCITDDEKQIFRTLLVKSLGSGTYSNTQSATKTIQILNTIPGIIHLGFNSLYNIHNVIKQRMLTFIPEFKMQLEKTLGIKRCSQNLVQFVNEMTKVSQDYLMMYETIRLNYRFTNGCKPNNILFNTRCQIYGCSDKATMYNDSCKTVCKHHSKLCCNKIGCYAVGSKVYMSTIHGKKIYRRWCERHVPQGWSLAGDEMQSVND